ncbi:MAG: hypothetical protein ACI8PZ_007179 [Myxococcota bacterium]|jgi:hypothetical protein
MRLAILVVALLTGCGGDDGTDTDMVALGTATGGGGGGSDVQPATGTWRTTNYDVRSDDCGLWSPSTETDYFPETFDVIAEEDGTFTIDGPALSVNCTSSGTSFTCAEDRSSEPYGYGLSADILLNIAVSGSFKGDSALDGDSVVELDCDGADCPQVTTAANLDFPCVMRLSIDAELE